MLEQEKFVSDLRNNRIKNTGRTAALRMAQVTVAAIGPFFVRTVMIYVLGDVYAGLNDLFLSVISVLNMAELGLSNVITFFLYEPLAKGDRERTEHYLNVMRRVYRYIGTGVLLIGLVITPFLPYLTKDSIPLEAHLYLSFVLFLLATCVQYFVLPEIMVLANASQKGYLTSISGMTGCIVVYILQTVALVVFRSFVLYYAAVLVQAMVVLCINGYIKKRCFQEYTPCGDISPKEKRELKKKILSLIGHQMDEKFISSADKIVISIVLGLSAVTRYGNYMFVVTAVMMLFSSVFASLTASLGNACVTESRESNYARFRAVLWLNGIMASWAAGCMFCMYQTFMEAWMRDRLFPIETVVLFCIYFFVIQIRSSVITFKNAIGMWWEDRYKPYISMIVNLALDILMVNLIGVNGALLASILCISLIEIPWEVKVLYQGYFSQSAYKYFGRVIGYAGFTAVMTIASHLLCTWLITGTGISALFEKGLLTTVLFFGGVLLVFGRSEEFGVWKESIHLLFSKNRS